MLDYVNINIVQNVFNLYLDYFNQVPLVEQVLDLKLDIKNHIKVIKHIQNSYLYQEIYIDHRLCKIKISKKGVLERMFLYTNKGLIKIYDLNDLEADKENKCRSNSI